MSHKKKEWGPHPSRRGVLTARAKRAGVSVHAEAEKDAHMKGNTKKAKRMRSEGVFALNAESHKFKNSRKLNKSKFKMARHMENEPFLGETSLAHKRSRKPRARKRA